MRKLAASLLISTIVACGGGGGETGNDSAACNIIGLNAKVINGTTCQESLNSSVVRLAQFGSAGDFQGVFCTGVMIAPRTVLTAAHCAGAFGSGTVAAIAGDPGNVRTSRASTFSIAPGFRRGEDRLFDDVMIVRLVEDLSIPVMPVLLSRSVDVGEPGYVFGYGTTVVGSGADPEQGLELQGGTMTVREVTSNHIFVLFDGNVNVCNGDSGGPLIVSANGQPAVAGIVSQGSKPGCAEGDVTTFTNLQSSSVLPWLAREAPNAAIRSLTSDDAIESTEVDADESLPPQESETSR
ncbi:MAG: S1 family peptidase [Pseudomonadota bacterium]|jgi:secreted trypsin-like serine protease